jgi:DNA-directed RNA polymerase specialized sigma24 family protein
MKEVLVAGFDRDFIYCSPLLPVESLDRELGNRLSPLHRYADPDDSPELALIKKLDCERLHLWAVQLPADLAAVAPAILRGETQAAIARRLGISEPAVTKRLARLVRSGSRQLGDLRHSPLLA